MRGEFVEIGQHRLYYYAAGSRGQGDPVVLIHGFPTTSHLWSNLVSLLPKGHRIIVPDLLGFGRSDLGDGADMAIAGHARRVVGLLDVLGIRRACIAGHHLGAAIAGTVAARASDRVTHLALLHPLAGDVTFAGTLAVLRASLPFVRVVPAPAFRASLRRELSRWYADPARARPSIDQYLAGLLKAPRWRAFLRQLAAVDARDMLEFTSELRSVQCPVAIVASGHDPAVPRVALDHIRGALPAAALDIVTHARHFTPEESPEQVAGAIARLLVS